MSYGNIERMMGIVSEMATKLVNANAKIKYQWNCVT